MKYFKNTDVGVVREENQDRAEVFENDFAFIALLCDGMGGHFGGSMASSITINTFRQRIDFLTRDQEAVYDWFKETIKAAKQNMINEAGDDENKKDMGTTVTAAVIFKENFNVVVFNIGDSRTYLFNGILNQITIDHNLMNYYILREHMSEFEASKLPGAAALTSALGPNKKTNIEAFTIDSVLTQGRPRESKKWFSKKPDNTEIINKTYIVLTSDGIHDYITKPNFESIIANNEMSLEDKSKELINQAIKGSSADNLTCIIVEVE